MVSRETRVLRRAIVAMTTALALLPAIAPAQQPDAGLDARLETLCERLDELRDEQHIPGVALVIVNRDGVVLCRGFGERDIAAHEPVTPDTLFAIGSATKSFTAVLCGMLADEGVLSLDDRVQRYVREFALKDAEAAQEATLRDLLCHRTGLTRTGLLWASGKVAPMRAVQQLAEAEPVSKFRSAWHYNNLTYATAGYAAARAAGTRWGLLLEERICRPLGMQHTNTSHEQLATDDAAARGYRYADDAFERLPVRNASVVAPAGAINSSAREMGYWLQFLLDEGAWDGKQLIKPATLEELWTPQIAMAGGASYGLGWMIQQWEGRRLVQHGGNIDGYFSAVALLPDEGWGFALLGNVGFAPMQAMAPQLVFEAVLGVESSAAASRRSKPGQPRTRAELEPYFGTYRVAMLGVDATVKMEGDKLAIDIPGQTVYTLHWPDTRDRWVFELTDDIELAFDEPEDGQVPAATLYQEVNLRFERAAESGEAAAPLPDDLPPAGEPWSVDLMMRLEGAYTGAGQTWKIVIVDDELGVDIPGQQVWPLHWPDAEGRWQIKVDPKQSLKFVTGADGRVARMDFRNNLVIPMPRVRADRLDVSVADVLALGGGRPAAAALQQRLRATGTIDFVNQGVRAPITMVIDGPRRMASHLDVAPFGYARTVVDDNRGWIESDLERTTLLTDGRLELARLENPLLAFGDWPAAFASVAVVREDEVDGEPVYVVRCVPLDAPAIKRFVSKKTGRVVREETHLATDVLGYVPMTTTYADYRDINGIAIPHQMTMSNPDLGRFVTTIEKIETIDAVPADAFELPAALK
jgi:CubicO group peptidase (beta-lactamase class C family)